MRQEHLPLKPSAQGTGLCLAGAGRKPTSLSAPRGGWTVFPLADPGGVSWCCGLWGCPGGSPLGWSLNDLRSLRG